MAIYPSGTQSRLIDHLGQTFILAYKEPTEQLSYALTQAGCDCSILRQVHQPGYETYSPSFLCLLNHRHAWELALRSQKPTLIVEADFVPVQNWAELPPPFDPADEDLGIAWLYTCAAQIYNVSANPFTTRDQDIYAQGYSTSMVAYVITAKSARLLFDLAAQVEQDPGPQNYSPWDSGIEYYLRDRNLHNYVPFRNYGEHGGLPNPEHQQNRLSKAHRADVLYGPLAFAPMYAAQHGTHAASPSAQDSSEPSIQNQINHWQWLKGRLYGRIKGLGRLLLMKYLRAEVVKNSANGWRLISFAIARHLTV